MIKIPNENKKISQPNNSDLFGNIWYTKNIDFDEEGYIKLASRTALMKSEEDDANFDLPLSLGRQGSGFHVVTADQVFDADVHETDFGIDEDTSSNNPSGSFDSWGVWFNNRWHASTNTKVWYETVGGGGWTDTGISVSSGKVHVLENFRNKNALAVANGNEIKVYDTSYSLLVTLTIPADFEIVGMKYNNNRLGIMTRLSDTAESQNQEAYFFVWDGATSSANAGYGVGSDALMGIVAYKSTWAIVTRAGELKHYNGGGFTRLGAFPFYFTKNTWGDALNRETLGDNMQVDGELILINIGNDIDILGKDGQEYMQNFPAGIWCYDPEIGLHHRYSLSASPCNQVTVTSGDINTTTDILTKSAGTLYATGTPIKYIYNGSTPIGGLKIGQVYYIIKHTSTQFSLAETKEDALNGEKIDITGTGAANNYFLALNVLDYGATRGERAGGIALMESAREVCDHILFGAEVLDYNSQNFYAGLMLTLPGFENRGYFITAKATSNYTEDNIPCIFAKYRPLRDTDKIIIKYKEVDILDLPMTTPRAQSNTHCTWVSETQLTTPSDLSAAKEYFDDEEDAELEIEIYSGAGAGQMVQVESIEESGGTYTINLAESIDGVAAGYTCGIIIDNWKLLKTDQEHEAITSENQKGWEEFPLAKTSKWFLFKVELRGCTTTLEELKINNKKQKA